MVVEALCFDFAVDQPWPILRAAVRGIDGMWVDEEGEQATGARQHRATEAVITELGWAMLNEGYLAPLPVLYRPEYVAFAVFTLILAMIEEMHLDEATAAAIELAGRFGLDIPWRESPEPNSEGEEAKAKREPGGDRADSRRNFSVLEVLSTGDHRWGALAFNQRELGGYFQADHRQHTVAAKHSRASSSPRARPTGSGSRTATLSNYPCSNSSSVSSCHVIA